MTVAAYGSVATATVDRGEEPWAGAALARANDLRFSPATRDGLPIAGIVRIEIAFTPVSAEPVNATASCSVTWSSSAA